MINNRRRGNLVLNILILGWKDDVILQRDSLNQQDYDNEEGLEYDKNAGCYLHLVDAIYTKLEGEDDSEWLTYVRDIRRD